MTNQGCSIPIYIVILPWGVQTFVILTNGSVLVKLQIVGCHLGIILGKVTVGQIFCPIRIFKLIWKNVIISEKSIRYLYSVPIIFFTHMERGSNSYWTQRITARIKRMLDTILFLYTRIYIEDRFLVHSEKKKITTFDLMHQKLFNLIWPWNSFFFNYFFFILKKNCSNKWICFWINWQIDLI